MRFDTTPLAPFDPLKTAELVMPPLTDLHETVLTAWRTNSRVTAYLVEHIPDPLWDVAIPGAPRRTVRMIAGHLHNARCMWLKTLGREHGIATPASIDRHKVSRRELLAALERSSQGMEALLKLGIAAGGHVPPSKGYVWRNLPLDVPHVLTYFVAHEGHHRGQMVMLARQLGCQLPSEVTNGLWMWTKRTQEARGTRTGVKERPTARSTPNAQRPTRNRSRSKRWGERRTR